MHPNNIYTITQAAAALNCSRQYIHKLIKQKKLFTAQKIGNQWIITANEIENFKKISA